MSVSYTTGLTAESSAVVIDTNGRRISGDITIELMPGNGISGPDGRHLDRENGPHTLPVAFALPLVHSGRARKVDPVPQADGAESIADPAREVPGAPEGVVSRDPVIESRERPRKRR